MKLAGRIPVIPLDDERMANLERRVVAGATEAAVRGSLRGRSLTPWLAATCIAAVAAAAVLVLGDKTTELPGPDSAAVVEPAPIRVATTAERSVIDIGDARITSGPATELSVTRPGGGVLVALSRGMVELSVDKRGNRPPLIVRAGDTDVVVVGTRFTVDYGDGRGEVAVQVVEGVVRVVHQQQETRVAAGQRWQTSSGLAANDAPAQRPQPSVADASHATGPALHTQVPDLLHAHQAAVPEAHLPVATAPARPTAATAKPSTGSGPRRPKLPPTSDPQRSLRDEIRIQRVEPAIEIGETDPSAAVARYYDIAAHKSGAEASAAFYSIAVVRHEMLGRNAEALEALDAYVRRFPGGKEYRAALWLRVRILCFDQIDDRCQAAAYTYLHQAPDGPAAETAERITRVPPRVDAKH